MIELLPFIFEVFILFLITIAAYFVFNSVKSGQAALIAIIFACVVVQHNKTQSQQKAFFCFDHPTIEHCQKKEE